MDRKQQMLSNMYTFAIAGKFLSFTKAAEELFITQGAVSQRIKSLEEQLGFSLFVRMTRRLELTKEGERLLHALNQSFDVIFSELEDIKFNELRGELYIGAAPTFAQSWLLPRLPDFQRLYPHLNIKLRVKASRLDFQHELTTAIANIRAFTISVYLMKCCCRFVAPNTLTTILLSQRHCLSSWPA